MTKEDVFIILKSHPNGNVEEYCFKKKFPELYQEIINISFPSDFKWTQKLYHFFHDDLELKLGICHTCGKKCKFISFNIGYRPHCSQKCAVLDEQVQLKTIQTCLNRYGVEKYTQTHECQEKMKETCLKKYGVEHYTKTDEYKERYKETCLAKYDNKHFSQTNEYKEKCKETCLNRYGVANYSQTKEYHNKIKQTCLKKYGAEYYTQTHEAQQYRRKRIEYDGLMFDSSWEVIVYQYCKENNIPCEYQPNIQFEYFYEGKKHTYQPDFLINNQLYEIKGDQFFEGDKMINPFDRTKDGLFESKHQCMIENNVMILKKQEIYNLKDLLNKRE